MSALEKGVADESVEAAKRFARECLGFQFYHVMTGEFKCAPGQRVPVYVSFSGQQQILAMGAGSTLKGKE